MYAKLKGNLLSIYLVALLGNFSYVPVLVITQNLVLSMILTVGDVQIYLHYVQNSKKVL